MFSFRSTASIVVGAGTSKEVAAIAARFGRRVLVIHGGHTDPTGLPSLGGATTLRAPSGEPTVEGVRATTAAARAADPDVIVAWGGGSVIDLAKAFAVLVRSEHDVLDHIEVIGAGVALPDSSVPVIAVPTTSGTGAETTPNAPVTSPEHGVKASLRSPTMLPVAAVVDPELTLSCPPSVTASAGLDALTQCLESLTSNRANPITDGLAREGLRLAARGLRRAYADGSDVDARQDMSVAALLSGMALANSKLGAVHGLAAPLGGVTGAAHGALCAAVLAVTTEVNVRALSQRAPGDAALGRYDEAAQILTGVPSATVEDGTAWLRETVALLRVPTLGALGLDRADHARVATAAMAASSMAGNPIRLTHDELLEILDRSA